jgi:hypothetical protein
MNEQLEIILQKMCGIAKIDYELVSFSDGSHLKLEWSSEQCSDFKNWLSNEIISNKFIRKCVCAFPSLCRGKKRAHEVSSWFVFQHGFKIKD